MKSLESLYRKITHNKTFEQIYEKVKAYWNEQPQPPKTYSDPMEGEYFVWKSFIDEQIQLLSSDKQKYSDYDTMDSEIPELSAALDIMADFVVYPDNVNRSKVFKVRSKDKRVNKAIEEIELQTNFNKEFYSVVRETCKYGDDFEEILFFDKKPHWVYGIRNIPADTVVVNIENGIKSTKPMIKQIGDGGEVISSLTADECLQFTVGSDRKRLAQTGKGISELEKSRLIYRQLRLMEEGLMIGRLSRSNQNYGLIVDVGDLTGDEALDYLEKYRKKLTRKKYIDPQTGKLSYKLNPLSVVEDLLIPTRQGSGSNIVNLNDSSFTGKIDDIVYFQDKMIYSTGVPKLLIGKDQDINSKSSSDVQYISFLRKIRRIQTSLEPEIIRYYSIALKQKGLLNFDIYLEWPLLGTIDEERKWNIEKLKYDIANMLSTQMSLIDDYYIYKNFMGMSDDEIKELTTRLDKEEEMAAAEFDAQIAKATDKTGDDSDEAEEEFKTAEDKEKEAEDEKASEEDIQSYFANKLNEKDYKVFSKNIQMVMKNKSVREGLLKLIDVTKLRLGE